jgi:hypothetical protein
MSYKNFTKLFKIFSITTKLRFLPSLDLLSFVKSTFHIIVAVLWINFITLLLPFLNACLQLLKNFQLNLKIFWEKVSLCNLSLSGIHRVAIHELKKSACICLPRMGMKGV